jgi:hypothetical protein
MSALKIVKKITLTAWAHKHYGANKPHINTLRKWASTGLIKPEPIKTGRAYMVQPDAQYTPAKVTP